MTSPADSEERQMRAINDAVFVDQFRYAIFDLANAVIELGKAQLTIGNAIERCIEMTAAVR